LSDVSVYICSQNVAILNQPFNRIKALIIDDEVIAIKNLKTIIDKNWSKEIEISGTAISTADAAHLIKEIQPEVLFLDIELRNENAFQFLEKMKPFSFEIIFVTAYDEYALRALKLNALDYILKPISIEELEVAIGKLRQKLSLNVPKDQENYSEIGARYIDKANLDRIVLKNTTSMKIVLLKNLFYIEAKRSYSCFHFMENGTPQTMLLSKPVSYFSDCLPQALFYRIHKSYIVNCSFISGFSIGGDQYLIELNDGTKLPLSRRKHGALQEFLKEFGK
jgi:two-component system LytT family response regulator